MGKMSLGYADTYGHVGAFSVPDVIAHIDARKNQLAGILGLGTSWEASGHLYPASYNIWSTPFGGDETTPAPGNGGFPKPDLLNALLQRRITPYINWTFTDGSMNPSGPWTYHIWQTWADGAHNGYLDSWSESANKFRDDHYGGYDMGGGWTSDEIILRFGWEMTGNWFPWSPGRYGNTNASLIAGWKAIHDRIRITNKADRVKTYWCAQGDTDFQHAYPGDAWCQYIGFDLYTERGASPWVSGSPASLAWLTSNNIKECERISNRPIIIGETGVSGGGQNPGDPLRYVVYPTPPPDNPYPSYLWGTIVYLGTGAERATWLTTDGGIPDLMNNYPNFRGIAYFDYDLSSGETINRNWLLARNPEVITAWAVLQNTYRDRYGGGGP